MTGFQTSDLWCCCKRPSCQRCHKRIQQLLVLLCLGSRYLVRKSFVFWPGQFQSSVYFIFIFSVQFMLNKDFRWLDSNHGSMGLVATALPTVPQPLPWIPNFWSGKTVFLCFRKRRKRTGSYDLTTSNLDRLYFIAKIFTSLKRGNLLYGTTLQ